jgi:CO/xanthine dehydrogenase Mo-binding subunit
MPKLTEQQTKFLRARQLEDTKAIAAYTAAAEAVAKAQAKRSEVLAEADKLVAEAEAVLADASRVVIERLGPNAAQALGLEVPAQRRPRQSNRTETKQGQGVQW